MPTAQDESAKYKKTKAFYFSFDECGLQKTEDWETNFRNEGV